MAFDLVIKAARVLDGTGGGELDADVAIEGDRIARIGSALSGQRELVAEGMMLAPGFVDVHAHDDAALLRYPDMAFKLGQGCTSVVVGNCGFCLAPFENGATEPPGNAGLFMGVRPSADFREYFAAIEAARPGVNVKALVGHNAVRSLVCGNEERSATGDERRRMREHVERALEQGACGFSTGLIYRPGRASDSEEIVDVATPLRAQGAIYTTHLRSEGERLLEAVEEAITIGSHVGCAVQISHHKASGRRNWGRVEASQARIDRANDEGGDVAFDVYPYTAGSGPMVEYFDPERVDLELAAVTRIASCPPFPELEGRMLSHIAAERGQEAGELVRAVLGAPGGHRTLCITFTMNEDDVVRNIVHPRAMIGSDGLPDFDGKPHPRLFGTFPRVLGEYARRRGLLSMAEAVRKMTRLPSMRFGLRERGLVAEGCFADLVLFDPESVDSGASFDDPKQRAVGIHSVFVNGSLAYRSGQPSELRTGRVLRHAAVGA